MTIESHRLRSIPLERRQDCMLRERDSPNPVSSLVLLFRSLQLRVLGFGFFQDWDVGVGVFPEGEEIFVGGERPDAGGIGICALRASRLQGIGTSHSQMRQSSGPAVPTMPLWSIIF
jgi:hypothetical protein